MFKYKRRKYEKSKRIMSNQENTFKQRNSNKTICLNALDVNCLNLPNKSFV